MPKTEHSCFKINAKSEAEAEILIYGDIGEDWLGESVAATQFVNDLKEIDADVITARINSYGGSVTDGLAIYNAMRRHSATVVVEIDGIAASIASLIAMAGDSIHIAENARMMIHAPWAGAVGNSKHFRDIADQLDGWAESMASAYTSKGMEHDTAMQLLTDGDDHWFGAAAALEAGLVDNVTEALDVAAKYQDNRFTRPKPVASSTAATVAAPKGEPTMADDDKATVTAQSEPNVVEIQNAAEKKALAALGARNDKFKVLRGMARTDEQRAEIDKAILDPTVTEDQLYARIAELPEQEDVTPAASAHVEITVDDTEKFRTGASAALAMRMGVVTPDRQNPYRGMALHEIAADSLRRSGINTRGMTKSEIASKTLIQAAKTTADFPLLLIDAANKALQSAYEAFPSTWNRWCATGEVVDFKTVHMIRLGSFNSLDTIAENDPYTEGDISEEKETLTAVTKGKYIGLSRKMIINDDLQGFSRMAALLGRAAARTVNKDVYELLTSGVANNGPTMSDTNQLFDAAHSNLAAAGGAISVDTLSAGKAAMRTQTDPSGLDYLNIMPATLAVPVAVEDHARKVVLSESVLGQENSGIANPVRNIAEVVSDPYLDAASATGWYLIASPADAPLMEVHFLDGNQSPYLEEEVQFMTDEVRWKVRMDYGVAANDWRGGYRNPGA